MTRKQLSRFIFHKETIYLPAGLALLWLSISLLADSTGSKSDLVPHTGRISRIDSVIVSEKGKPFSTIITRELRIGMDNEAGYFTIVSSDGFGDIVSRINPDDSITIYTKRKLWGIFGLKSERDICELQKGDKVIVSYEMCKRSISGQFILTLALSLGLLIYYFHRAEIRYWLLKRYPDSRSV
ncbi:MAG: hypothetical protein ABW019_03530 [Chitinophagaceae bacterium]